MAGLTVRATDLVVEGLGFRLTLRPRLALSGPLAEPTSMEAVGGEIRLRFAEGSAVLHVSEPLEGVTAIVAEADGYSSDGVVAEVRGRLEGFGRLLLYHFTYDPDKYFGDAEPYAYPQLREAGELEYCPWSYPIHAAGLEGLPRNLKVSQLLAKNERGYAFLLPVSDAGCRGYISRFEGGGFSVMLHRGVGGRWRRVSLLVFSTSTSPYAAVERGYEAAFGLIGKAGSLRRSKKLAEPFRYLGWCSWNACWREPTADRILSACRSIAEKGIRLGFVLIDDGWQDEEAAPWPGQRIRRLAPDARKFPAGFAPLVGELKRMGIKYVGLWHTLNVHWGGVAKGSELDERWRGLLVEADGYRIPDPARAFELFRDWYATLRGWGFDFVKVDNQSFVGYAYAGRLPVEEAARRLHEGLEAAAHVNSLEVLNCMAQQPENVFNWLRSTVARNCVDYIVPHRKSRDKLHLYFNAYNALFMSQVVWPDWDMFQSHDPWALQQAVARAVSGGPVYITDEPGKTVAEVVRPLAFSDGSLPLPDHPALPTEDVLMRDPYNEPVPLKVFTRVSVEGVGTYGIVAAFNIHKDDAKVRGSVSPSDALLPEGDYLLYEYFSGELKSQRAEFELEPMGVKLFVIAPRSSWLVPIGLADIYLMPRGIDAAAAFEDEVVLMLREAGTLVVRAEGDVKVEGGEGAREGQLLKIKCRGRVVRLRR